MNPLAFQLLSLQFELSMAMSSTLELDAMLKAVANVLLRRVDAQAVGIYQAHENSDELSVCLCMPLRAEFPETRAALPWNAQAPVRMVTERKTLTATNYLFPLPGFGLLELDCPAGELSPTLLRALEPLVERLGRTARACADHAATRSTQARFAEIMQTVPEVIYEGALGHDGLLTFTYVSPRALDVLGVSATALMSDSLAIQLIAGSEWPTLQESLRQAAHEKSPFEHVLRIDRPHQKTRWLLLAGRPQAHHAENVELWSGFVQDVTAREELALAQRALSELQLSTLLNTVGDAIIGSDENSVITHWNPSAEKLLGWSVDQAIGAHLHLIIPDRHRTGHIDGMRHHLLTGETRVVGRPVELPALHADGHEIPVELVLNRVQTKDTILFFGVLRDLTERKRAEMERQLALEQERRYVNALRQISATGHTDDAEYLMQVMQLVAEALEVDRASLWRQSQGIVVCEGLFDAPGNPEYAVGTVGPVTPRRYLARLRDEQVVVLSDLQNSGIANEVRAALRTAPFTRALLDAAMDAWDDDIWILRIESANNQPWTTDQRRFCSEALSSIAQEIERFHHARFAARHQAILSSIGDGVIACDLDGNITLMNLAAESLTGWHENAARGEPLERVLNLQARTGSFPIALNDDGSPDERSMTRLIRPDGVTILVSVNDAPIFQDGVHIGRVVTFSDISAREDARVAIEKQYQRMRSLGRAIPDLLFVLHVDGSLWYLQGSAHADLLTSPDAASNSSLQQIFPEELATEIQTAVQRAVASNELQTVQYSLELPQGRQRFEARLAPMNELEVTALVRNVTREYERERMLQEERERMAVVLSSTSAIIYSANLPDFSIDYISDSAATVLGFSRAEFSAPGFWESAVHPDDQVRVKTDLGGLFVHGHHTHEYRHRHARGGYRWLRDEVRLLLDPQGVPLKAVGASFDITDRRQIELRLESTLEVQRAISSLSTDFLTHHDRDITPLMMRALSRIGHALKARRAYFVAASEQPFTIESVEWTDHADGQSAIHSTLLPDWWRSIWPDSSLDDRRSLIRIVANLPAEERKQLHPLLRDDVTAFVWVPLLDNGRFLGLVGVDNPDTVLLGADEGLLRYDPRLSDDLAVALGVYAEVLQAGVRRMADERSLRQLNVRISQQLQQQRTMLDLSSALVLADDQQDFFHALHEKLNLVPGCVRTSLVRRIGNSSRYTIQLFVMKGDLPPDQAAQFVSDTTKTIEVDETELAGSAPMASMLGREVISTLREPLERFHDWVRLRDFTGWSNFIVVPLLNTDGAFGTFNVTFSYTIQEEDVDWVGQLGAVISAHLTSMAARDALRDLNRTLEERVEDRTQALRASQERFTALFNYAPQAMLIVDGDGRLVQFNRGALRLLRATEQELANTTVNDLIPPNLRDSHRLLMRGFMQQENPGPMAPNRIVQAMRPDGTVFLADIGLVPIHINEQPLVVVGISDTTERVEAQRSIERSLKEKETLLKEIHHRVKNNLQIISSLLMLQCEQMPAEEVRVALMDSVLRVRSMALIHQQLYGVESLAKIDFGDYARTLAESLRSVLAPRARLQVTADLVEVTIGTAVPLGLILNELLTNAFKYGVPEHSTRTPGRTGPLLDVSVEVRTIGDEVSLAVIDSGPGMPENFDIERSRSLGLQLIRSLRRQLRGRFSYDSDRGSRFEIICPAAARE